MAATSVAPAAILVGVTNSTVIRFDSAAPGTIISAVPITGLLPGDTIRGIDVRPATGLLYGLAVNNPLGTDEGRIYLIDPVSGIAVQVSNTPFSTALAASTFFGIDVDHAADQIRIVNTSDQNMRVNPSTGALIATDTSLAHASTAEEVAAIAYDRPDTNSATPRTLFGIDFITNTLVRIGGVDGSPSPDAGVLTTIGSLALTANSRNIGFDISAAGVAYASIFTNANGWRLYTINLATGAATSLGAIGSGTTQINGIAVLSSAAPGTVRNINTGESFATIQAAINDIDTTNGHIIEVGAGTWSELVTVSKGVTLRGPNFGLHGAGARGTEAFVNGTVVSGSRTTSFNVTANSVAIDGFVVEGTTNQNQFGPGIKLGPGTAGSKIRNNIIRNNIRGLSLANNSAANQTVITRNAFLNNNATGGASGNGIYTDQFEAGGGPGGPLTNVLIDDNSFTGNGTAVNGGAGLNFSSTLTGSQTKITISNNIFDGNARALLAFNLVDSSFTHNTVSNSNFNGSADVRVFEGVSNLAVTNNLLQGGAATTFRGMRISNIGTGAGDATGIVFECNSISGYTGAGLEIDNGAYAGPFQATLNWWGSATGPTIASNPGGTGLAIIDPATQVVYNPFATTGTDFEPLTPGFECRPTATLYGVDSSNTLLRFNSATPEAIESSAAITGLLSGEIILGIDFRPTTGQLFALGSENRLYTINPANGAATLVAGLGPAPGDDNPFMGLTGSQFGVSFNPVPDLAGIPSFRVISNTDENLRINANNGQVTTDTDINPASLSLQAAAYTNNDLDPATGTTLFGYDFVLDNLVSSPNPNGGTYNVVGNVGFVSSSGISMDIQTLPGPSNRLFATIPNTARSNLYRLDLVTGRATFIGPIGPSAIVLRALAVEPGGTFAFSAPNYSVGESGPVALITINRNGGTAGSVEVTFSTSDGTATAPADYTDSDQVVVFPDGVPSVAVSIPLVNDFATEGSQTVNLALSNPTGGALLSNTAASAVLTITDNDSAGIAVTKFTNGTNNNSPPGPSVPVGSTVTFTYTVTNTGNVPLAGVTVRDDNGTSGNLADDFNATFSSGDTNGNGLLDLPETFAFTASRIATSGQYTNIGTASGSPSGGGATVSATDPDNHFGVSPSPTPTPGVVANVATRLPVGTGDDVLIEGFIVLGPNGSTKKIMVRALGPFLIPFGIPDALPNPTLEIRDGSNTLIATNNDWRNTEVGGIITGDQAAEIEASGLAPSNDLESAIIADLAPGSYTAVVRGVNDTTGTGIVDAYDISPASPARLANIATRGLIQPGDQLMIAGFITQSGDVRAVIRAIGPSLSAFGIANALPDTTLQLRDVNGTIVRQNDDWESDQKAELEATGLQPGNALEAAIVETLPPGQYTAQVRGKPETTGIGVVEIYFLQ